MTRDGPEASDDAVELRGGMIQRGEAFVARLQTRLGRRGMLVLSALSAVWGVVSGISLKRGYENSHRLLAYLALFVLVSAGFRLWLNYAGRLAQRSEPVAGVRAFLLAKPGLVDGAHLFTTQIAVQYIAMFCIPLLAFAGAWTTLILAVLLAAVSLIDPWWARLSRSPWCMAMVRCFTAVIATSFAFAVYWPQRLAYFYPTLAVVACLSVLPWDLLLQRSASETGDSAELSKLAARRPTAQRFGPTAVVLMAVMAQLSMNSWLRVPLLSVWLRDPTLGTEVDGHVLSEPWAKVEPAAKLNAALASEDGLCCMTPIVSPSGTEARVTHEWLVDGSVVDRILLSQVRGQGSEPNRSFRTYSCKHHLPAVRPVATDTAAAPTRIHTIGCRAYLDSDIYIGRVDVSFQ